MVSRRPPAFRLPRHGVALAVATLGLLASACQTPNAVAPLAAPQVARELAVGFKDGLDESARSALRASVGATRVLALGRTTEVWSLDSAASTAAAAAALAGRPGIEYTQANATRRLQGFLPKEPQGAMATEPAMPGAAPGPTATPGQISTFTPSIIGTTDPDIDKQWYLTASGFTEVWSASTGAGVTVAVIDSGVDPGHPDLQANLLPMIDEVAARSRKDVSYGRDYAGKDGNGHGTHVAGIIGAVANNGRGVRGAASGVKLLPIKVTSALGETDDVTIAKGIYDAVDAGAHVINLSIGGPDPSLLLLEALNYAFNKGVTVVIAAGNESRDVNYPAAFDGVVAVGALTATNEVASYSNRGPKLVICAPGGGKAGSWEGAAIYSTTPTYPCHITQTERNTTEYGYLAGTSMATPLVTAAVALILAHEPGLAPAQVRTRLAATADDLGAPGYDERSGFGALAAKRAFDYGRKP